MPTKNMVFPAHFVLALLFLQGCASHVTLPVETSERKRIPTWYAEHAETRSESRVWYTPWNREEFLYGVAEDVSPSMEMALKKATLKAKTKIADRVTGEVQRQTSITYREEGSPNLPVGDARTIDEIHNAIQKIYLGNYNTTKKEIVFNPDTGNYRAFVLLKVRSADLVSALKTR